ncbi:MAG: tyrosine-type recombinase/integrase [Thermoleophilaceae bacterium]
MFELAKEKKRWGVSEKLPERLDAAFRFLYPDAVHAGFRPDVVGFFSALRRYIDVGAGFTGGLQDAPDLFRSLKFAIAHVFCRADGGPIDRTTVRRRFARAQKAAGVRVRRFHDLRHTFGSLAIRHLDSATVQAMMGHSRLATTERYLHAKPRTDDAARLSEAFDATQPGSAPARARIG